jgi:hypothetical protein
VASAPASGERHALSWTERNLILGAILLPVGGLVTLTNFCIPSTLLGIWWRRRGTPVQNQVPDTT